MPTITFKVSTDEARRIRADARGKKMTVSEFIRGRALNGGGKPARFRHTLCSHTGAKIFSSPAGTPPLTTETVREILADFP
jgi:hypothetical protein